MQILTFPDGVEKAGVVHQKLQVANIVPNQECEAKISASFEGTQ